MADINILMSSFFHEFKSPINSLLIQVILIFFNYYKNKLKNLKLTTDFKPF